MTGFDPVTFRVLGGCDSHYTTPAFEVEYTFSFYNHEQLKILRCRV